MTSDASYRIAVEPVQGRVRARIDGQVVADSTDVVVMHETFLPSQCYFPKADVSDGLLESAPLRTFCPFKGTTTHWHLRLSGRTIENGAWSYEDPLEEGLAVGARVAFYPHLVEAYESDRPLPQAESPQVADSPLIDWLLREAWLCQTPAALTQQYAERLVMIGLPLWRFNVNIWTLHPELAGKRFAWLRDGGAVVESETPHGELQHPAYLNSPVRYVSEGLGGVRQRLDVDQPDFQFPILDELRRNGGTDYVAMPLPFSDGQVQTMSLATDAPHGFSTAQLGQVFESVTAMSRFYEVLTLRRNTTDLFDTYLGRRTRHQVLGGLTHRGDGEDIRAAILYCDLRDSTSLAAALSRESYLGLLNDFFECAAEPVLAHGGEVLKFIGDAVLAIFPLDGDEPGPDTTRTACARALLAAQEIVKRVASVPARTDRPTVQCAIGLHFGDVMYGNVGAPNRLDFTVTGTAANVAARLSGHCKSLQQSLLLSADVAKQVPEDLLSLGKQQLRHVADDFEVFVPAGGQYG